MFDPDIRCDQNRQAFVLEVSKKISPRMAQRLSNAYNFAIECFPGYDGSFWAKNDERNAELIAALRAGHLDTICDNQRSWTLRPLLGSRWLNKRILPGENYRLI